MATELGKAYVQIVPSARGISGAISNELGGDAENAGKSLGAKLIGSLKKAVVAAGAGKLIVDSIKEGARYEQALGGIETLFKGSADTMKAYAINAYKTAGISANDYMEQATSFAASLLQSVDGNHAKAAEAANQAVIDMSDNANKMGSNIQDIQNAYQGFAKQNYTMLDNLKLGYGGTKTEMERLLKDAEEISGIHYDIDNLADVYEAIHVIQGELDITGTTAKEAATTLSGSFASMKAAASNFMAQLTMGEDISGAMSGLIESTVTFAGNLIPAIGRIFAGLPKAIGTAIQAVHPALMLGLAKAIVAVKNKAPQMISNALNGLLDFSATLRKNAGQLVNSGLALIKVLADSIIKNIPVFIQTVPTILSNFAGIINDNAPKIMSTGWSILKSLAVGIVKAVPVLIQELPKILKAMWDIFTAFQWINLGKTIITGIKNGITAMGEALKGAGKSITDGLANTFKTAWTGIKNVATSVWNAIRSFLSGNWNGIKSMASSAWAAIKGAITNPISSAKNLLSSAWNGIKSAASSVWGSIKSIASSAWNGIKSAMTRPIETAKQTISNLISKVKSFFPVNIGKAFKIKLPHVSVGSKSVKVGDKNVSVPTFSIDWYAKGGVFDNPSLIGVGEAGREIVTPEKLMRQIVGESNAETVNTLNRILDTLEYIAASEKKLIMDKREFGRMVNEVY